jgi:hypothetical protein
LDGCGFCKRIHQAVVGALQVPHRGNFSVSCMMFSRREVGASRNEGRRKWRWLLVQIDARWPGGHTRLAETAPGRPAGSTGRRRGRG